MRHSRRNFLSYKKRRKDAADARKVESDKLTPMQRMAKLDRYGHTAVKERAKIAKLVAASISADMGLEVKEDKAA